MRVGDTARLIPAREKVLLQSLSKTNNPPLVIRANPAWPALSALINYIGIQALENRRYSTMGDDAMFAGKDDRISNKTYVGRMKIKKRTIRDERIVYIAKQDSEHTPSRYHLAVLCSHFPQCPTSRETLELLPSCVATL